MAREAMATKKSPRREYFYAVKVSACCRGRPCWQSSITWCQLLAIKALGFSAEPTLWLRLAGPREFPKVPYFTFQYIEVVDNFNFRKVSDGQLLNLGGL